MEIDIDDNVGIGPRIGLDKIDIDQYDGEVPGEHAGGQEISGEVQDIGGGDQDISGEVQDIGAGGQDISGEVQDIGAGDQDTGGGEIQDVGSEIRAEGRAVLDERDNVGAGPRNPITIEGHPGGAP